MMYAKGDRVRLSISDIGTDGEGIGKVDGYTLFVKDTVIGDEAEAEIIKAKKNYGYGRLMEIISPSAARVEPVCPVARQCGGCQIQQMSYPAQLEYKRKLVEGNLRRIGGFDDIEVPQPIGMDIPYHYRNKAQYPVGKDKNGNVIMGFYAGRTHHIIDNPDCCIGAPENAAILETVKKYIITAGVSVYDENTGVGAVRHILIRKGFHTGEIMVCIIANAKKLPREDMLVKMLAETELGTNRYKYTESGKKDAYGRVVSVILNTNTDRTNVILGNECRTLWGKDWIEDRIVIHEGDTPSSGNTDKENRQGVVYRISPLSFYQVNPVQTEKLYAKAVEYAALTGNETVWDMYCGIGTISLIMAGRAKRVVGVEIVPQAIENAKMNAEINGIKNADFYVGKAESIAPKLAEKGDIPDVIVIDPPRKGCDEALLATMISVMPERIVYVSCDSATLARDLRHLCDRGYEIRAVQLFDQFCHTVHVETVVLMSRVSNEPRKDGA